MFFASFALGLMKADNVSQIPVRRNGDWVGRVVESDLMDQVFAGKISADELVEKCMADPFPILDAKAPYGDALKPLSARDSAVLVRDDSGVIGILTKYDLIEFMLAEHDG